MLLFLVSIGADAVDTARPVAEILHDHPVFQ